MRQKILNITKNEAQDLATILYHNAVFNTLKINIPIVTNFNGSVNKSTVNVLTYIEHLLNYQTYNISQGMLNIIEDNDFLITEYSYPLLITISEVFDVTLGLSPVAKNTNFNFSIVDW